MEMEEKKNYCPKLDVDGVVSGGKQFDLDITLPEDNRDVIYGVVKDCFKEPVCDAVVKLVEICYEKGKEERRPIGHTFTDKEGEFVFGPLCPGKDYAIQIWVNDTKKIKICAKCHHEGKCLKGDKHDKCDCFLEKKECERKECEKKDWEREYWERKDYEKKEYERKDCEKKECEKKECEKKECEKKECERKDCEKWEDKDCNKCEKKEMHMPCCE